MEGGPNTAATAAVAVTFATYAVSLLGWSPNATLPLAIGAIVVVSAINYVGVKPAAVAQNVFTVLKLAALAALIVSSQFSLPPFLEAPGGAASDLPHARGRQPSSSWGLGRLCWCCLERMASCSTTSCSETGSSLGSRGPASSSIERGTIERGTSPSLPDLPPSLPLSAMRSWTPALFVLAATYVVASSAVANPRNAVIGTGLLALGVPVYVAQKRGRAPLDESSGGGHI